MNGSKSLVTTDHAETSLPAEYGGSLAVSLARAEVDQQISTARAYPRSITRAVEHIVSLATLDERAAAECIYALPRGRDDSGAKKIIKGPSIRLAEIVAGQWGNCRVGARVVHVDRFEKYIEAEGVFHDLETNMATTSRVRRSIVDSKGRLYRDDMIIVTGNAACSIAKRNAIFSGVPRGVWRHGEEEAERIIMGDVKTLVSRRRSALATFAGEYKISAERVFAALEIDGEADIDLEKLAILTEMRSAIKNGEATIEEQFPLQEKPTALNEQLDKIAAKGNGNGAPRPPDPPHDPETGEIIENPADDATKATGSPAPANENGPKPNMENDPKGEEAGRQLKARLDERAESAFYDEEKAKIAEAKRINEKEQEAAMADRGLQRLLDDARIKAKEGALKLKYWVARLPKEQFKLIEPHVERLQAEANDADARPGRTGQ